MRKSEIKFTIDLDKDNVPEKIVWEATESPSGKAEETKAIALALWDPKHKSTMKIDLWTKDMPVDEMKQFFIETMGGMADTLQNATNDNTMAEMIRETCKKLVKHVQEEMK